MKKKHFINLLCPERFCQQGQVDECKKNTHTLCSVSVVLNECIYSSPREQTLHLGIIIESA